MVTEILFKNGTQLVFEHDQPPTGFSHLAKEVYNPTYDGVSYTLTIDIENILYKKVFANMDDYVCCIPVDFE
jgi:hypothetical protein